MRISAVVAMSEERVIGLDNKLPWHLPADLKHFKEVTMGKPIVMGRKTYESIGRALPGRLNIVISRDKKFQAVGCEVVSSIDEAIKVAGDSEEIFVIGGALIYEVMLPVIQRIYLTIVHHVFAGDAFFPEFNKAEWHETQRECYPADEKNLYPYSFIILERKLS